MLSTPPLLSLHLSTQNIQVCAPSLLDTQGPLGPAISLHCNVFPLHGPAPPSPSLPCPRSHPPQRGLVSVSRLCPSSMSRHCGLYAGLFFWRTWPGNQSKSLIGGRSRALSLVLQKEESWAGWRAAAASQVKLNPQAIVWDWTPALGPSQSDLSWDPTF